MILVGNQRGGAMQLAKHLMNDHDNDHVEIHTINGFIADDVEGALTEVYAISRATRCKQFMFSLSLSPPENAIVTIADFENAVEEAADRLGLNDQPRVMLFHEKKGRRHCHVVFSRIDTDKMTAINLPFYKEKLNGLARELFLTHGWDMPKGFQDRSLSDPLNYSLEEYQVAKRAERDPREIKATLIYCWQQSDSKRAFTAALQEKGFYLCKGDRRGFVALDWQGNIYSLSRWLNEKGRVLKAKLGEQTQLPSIEEAQQQINHIMSDKHTQFQSELKAGFTKKLTPLNQQRERIVMRQRNERKKLRADQQSRHWQEAITQSNRLRKGLPGLWDWVSGNRKKIVTRNTAEIEANNQRDQRESLSLVHQHRAERQKLQTKFTQLQHVRECTLKDLGAEFEKWKNRENKFGVNRSENEQWHQEQDHEPIMH